MKALDAAIVAVTLPVTAPLALLATTYARLRSRRPIPPNREVSHFRHRGVRTDYIAVDLSRTHQHLVGIRQRTWQIPPSGDPTPPPYSDDIAYIPAKHFWAPPHP